MSGFAPTSAGARASASPRLIRRAGCSRRSDSGRDARSPEGFSNPMRHSIGTLADLSLPNPEHDPAGPTQRAPIEDIARAIRSNLGDPVIGVCTAGKLLAKTRPMTPVPEVAIAKDRE